VFEIEILVLGQKWQIYLVDEDDYIRRFGDTDAAHANPSEQTIYFNEGELSRDTVVHELCHAFYSELCVGSASVTPEQVEEIFCDMFGKHGDRILRLGRRLYKEFRDESGS
jgi:hypothetical protein